MSDIDALKLGAEQYFKSLQNTFTYTKTNRRKLSFLQSSPSLVGLLALMLGFGDIPRHIANRLGNKTFNLLGLTINYSSPFVYWTIFIIISLLLIFFLLKLSIRIENKILLPNQLKFCLLFETVSELKSFQVNNHIIHIQNAKQNIKQFSLLNELKNPLKLEKDASKYPTLSKLLDYLKINFSWITLSEKTISLNSTFQIIDELIIPNSLIKKNASKYIDVFEWMFLYRYLNTTHSKTLEKDYFVDRANLENTIISNLISSVEDKKELTKEDYLVQKSSLLSKVSYFLNSYFYSKNILICFLSWFIFFFLFFAVCLASFRNYFNIQVDSTLLVGLFTVPSAIAIIFTQMIRNRN